MGLVLAAVAVPAAWGCGVCIEDKVAAAYDHSVVQRAKERGRVVVFAEVDGPGTPETAVRAAREAAKRVAGVEAASLRSAAAPAALSFALDPRVSSPEKALESANRLASGRAQLRLLKVTR